MIKKSDGMIYNKDPEDSTRKSLELWDLQQSDRIQS